MPVKSFILPDPDAYPPIRGDQLAHEITTDSSTSVMLTDDDLVFLPPDTVKINKVPDGEEAAVQAIVDDHVPNPLYFQDDYIQVQATNAHNNLVDLTLGLGQLDPEDLGYALLGRSTAKANGASPQEILTIVDRQTAASYIMGMPEWDALPQVAKDWFIVSLKAEAIRWQILAAYLS